VKIAVTGGGGLLSTELKKINKDLTLLKKNDVDVRKSSSFHLLENFNVIVHTAAKTVNSQVKGNEIDFIKTNIIGTANLVNYCLRTGKRLIYISTDYVYSGNGNHKEDEPLLPYNLYSWSKLGGEASVRFLDDYLIIRTSFGPSKFPYKTAFDNLYTSKDYVDEIAPLINKVIQSDIKGTINIGTDRKSVYEWANKRNTVKRGKLDIIKDFSMNLDKLNNI
jgi:dTDP-4-dehydrorhamnose reductase